MRVCFFLSVTLDILQLARSCQSFKYKMVEQLWCVFIIPAHGKLKQKIGKFLDYTGKNLTQNMSSIYINVKYRKNGGFCFSFFFLIGIGIKYLF